jgi:hypothetical protein
VLSLRCDARRVQRRLAGSNLSIVVICRASL